MFLNLSHEKYCLSYLNMQRDIQNKIITLESYLKLDIEFPLLRLLQFLNDLKSYFIGLF